MEAAAPLLEPLGHVHGMVVVRRLLGRVAAAEPDGPAAAQVDRGDHDHDRAPSATDRTKFE